MSDLSHLIRVEVIGMFDIVSVVGYRDDEEIVWNGNSPLIGGDGQPVTQTVRVEVTEDVKPGGFAFLDPEKTNIRALVKAGLVRIAPQKKAAAK